MINLTKSKSAKPVLPKVPTYVDVIADVTARDACGEIKASAAESYRSALRSCARRQNMPLEMCVADLERFDAAFPKDGFDPSANGSAQGYRLMRGRARGSIVSFLSAQEGKTRPRVDVDDAWSELLRKLKPLTQDHPTRWKLAPQKLIPITNLAKACRALNVQPRGLDRGVMETLETHYQGGRRESHRSAARILDTLRGNAQLQSLLPAQPIGFERAQQLSALSDLPEAFEAELCAWVKDVTIGDWDPVSEEHTDERVKHAHVSQSAFRTYLRMALNLGVLDGTASSCLSAFSDDVAPKVIGALLKQEGAPRQGDLLQLRWSAYDGTYIRLCQSKTGRRVTLPVGEKLKEILDRLKPLDEDRWAETILKNSRGVGWTSDGFRTEWAKAIKKAGIKGVTFHDLRGTAVTRFALAGCSTAEIATFTGHSLEDIDTILDEHYLSRDVELAETAMQRRETYEAKHKSVS